MTALPALIDAIESADLPAAIYRTAVRLARMADPQGRAVLAWDEYQQITGCGHADAARRHLRALRDASLISWRGGATVVVVWLASRHLLSENRPVVSESRQYVRVDNNNMSNDGEQKRPVVSEKRPVVSARQKWFAPKLTLRVTKKTCSVWKQTRSVGKRARSVSHSYVWARAVCLIDPIPTPPKEALNQTINQPPARDDTALAESLMLEVGVAPTTAKKLAVHGLDLVRRAVATWHTQRREVGGKMENHPGIVVYWLSNLGKAGIPPTLPAAWFDSELGAKYGGDPPAPQPAMTYAVDLPGVYRLPATVAPSEPAKPLPPRPLATEALPLDGIWLQMLRELFASLPASSDARAWLRDSRLEETGTAPDNAGRVVPLYTVWVTDPKGLDWCNNRAAITLRRMLGSMVGHSVMVVAALQAEPAAEVAVSA